MNYRIPLCSLAAVLLVSATLVAAPPEMMNYQGRLTDDAGDPVEDGSYTLVFTIYDGGDVQLWTESHDLAVSNGLFHVMLGDTNPLTAEIFDHDECWLGISVSGDPEMTPRARLITSPYAFRTATIDGASGGDISSDVSIDGNLQLGNYSQDGVLNLYGAGVGAPVAVVGDWSDNGGAMNLYDESGNFTVFAQPDINGAGGFLSVRGNPSGNQFYVDGNYSSTGNPRVLIAGSESSCVFNTNNSGDLAVELPSESINSDELSNEPGLAGGSNISTHTLSTAMTDLATVTITTPAAGYVLLIGKCYVQSYGDTDENIMYVQVDQLSGGSYKTPYVTAAGMTGYPSTYHYYYPVFAQRIYSVVAGSYTFRLEGMKTGTDNYSSASQPMITALYFPTSYGDVTAFVSDPTGFEQAVPMQADAESGLPGSPEQMYEVNLRELELRAARLRAATLEAEQALEEARKQTDEDWSE